MSFADLTSRQKARIFILAAILWGGLVVVTGNDLFPWYWLVSAVLLGFGVRHTLRAIDEA